jgi:hypothetical protein
MLRLSTLVWALAAMVPAHATSVRSASLDDLIQMSTSVVRGQVVACSASMRGALMYTHYTVQVLDRWKGPAAAQVDVQVPGGTSQPVDGAPQLAPGVQYVFFLWTGPSGANYPLGLAQGVLDVSSDATGNLTVERHASEGLAMPSASSPAATQDPLRMKLADFASRVTTAVKGARNTQ